jgi:hypothetical protein
MCSLTMYNVFSYYIILFLVLHKVCSLTVDTTGDRANAGAGLAKRGRGRGRWVRRFGAGLEAGCGGGGGGRHISQNFRI